MSRLGHRHRQFDRNGGLALLRRRAGEDDRLDFPFHLHEADVRAEGPVTLRGGALGDKVRDHASDAPQLVIADVPGYFFLVGFFQLVRVHLGDNPQHLRAEELLHLLHGADGRVEGLDHEGKDDAEDEADQKAQGRRGGGLRRVHGAGRFQSRLDDLDLFELLGVLDLRFLVLLLELREQLPVDARVPLQSGQLHPLFRQFVQRLVQPADRPFRFPDVLGEGLPLGGQLGLQAGDDLGDLLLDLDHLREVVRVVDQQEVPLQHQLNELLIEALVRGGRLLEVKDVLGGEGASLRLVQQLDDLADPGERRQVAVVGGPERVEAGGQRRRFGVQGDHAVLLPEIADRLLRFQQLFPGDGQLLLDELLGLDDAPVQLQPVTLLVHLRHRVGQPLRHLGLRRSGRDVDDVAVALLLRLDPLLQVEDDRQVAGTVPDLLGGETGRDQPPRLGHQLQDEVALDHRHLGFHVVGGGPGNRLEIEARDGTHLLHLDAGGGLVNGRRTPQDGGDEAEGGQHDHRVDDDEFALADRAPVLAEVQVVGHRHGVKAPSSTNATCSDPGRRRPGSRPDKPTGNRATGKSPR